VSYSQVIAIDGPSGSGKSTIARLVAQKVSAIYVDTGAMFRAIGYFCQQQLGTLDAVDRIEDLLPKIQMDYPGVDDRLIIINGEDLTLTIRQHEVSALASKISKIPAVREFLLEFQRALVVDHLCVMEGRDIGTVVFPDALCKIFLTASAEVRSKRRFDQLAAKGTLQGLTLAKVYQDVEERDLQDSSRKEAPLKQAKDAKLIDSEKLSIEQVSEAVVEHYHHQVEIT
jgi:CMP/dCMP kinase